MGRETSAMFWAANENHHSVRKERVKGRGGCQGIFLASGRAGESTSDSGEEVGALSKREEG